MGLCDDYLPGPPVMSYGTRMLAVDPADGASLAERLREHAKLHSDSKDIMLEAAAMLGPLES